MLRQSPVAIQKNNGSSGGGGGNNSRIWVTLFDVSSSSSSVTSPTIDLLPHLCHEIDKSRSS